MDARRALRSTLVTAVLLIASIPVSPQESATGQEATTEIVVTTSADAKNGDTSSAVNLGANPGPDGVSLREAIEATNNDLGSYDIRFDVSLSGATIRVDPACCGHLPPLTGGGVSIDGDIDGDGDPDVTIASDGLNHGLNVVSSHNELHALALQGFRNGVLITASPSHLAALPTAQTFAGNVVRGLVISDATSGIRIWPIGPDPSHQECLPSACETHNRWTDTQLVGNTIVTEGGGTGAIEVGLQGVAGDVVERLTIEGNVIRLAQPGHAMNLTVGEGAGADENRIADVVVAHNTIEVPDFGFGINTWSGFRGGSANVVEDLRISENTIHFSGSPPVGQTTRGIVLSLSDGCNTEGCMGPGTVSPTDNVVRRIEIVGNVIEGSTRGVIAADPCCGTDSGSRLTDVRIADNVIDVTIPPHDLNPWGIHVGTQGGSVERVKVVRNSIEQRAPEPRSEYVARLAGAAIGVTGGLGKERGSLRDVLVSRNHLDTPLLGISIIGGGPSDEFAAFEAFRNRVFGVTLRGNDVVQKPVLATRWHRKVKGITVIGGLGGPRPSTGNWERTLRNSVKCVRLRDNVVVGKRDVVGVFPNLGKNAFRNTARLGGC